MSYSREWFSGCRVSGAGCRQFGPRSKTNPAPATWRPIPVLSALFLLAVLCAACGLKTERRTIPAEVESTINSVSDDVRAERYEKIYTEAADLWRENATLEDSVATFKTLKTKLGEVENRTVQSATEQENSGGPLKGRAFIITYRTKFQRGEGMETFTLVERNGRWQLARYFVSSTALQ